MGEDNTDSSGLKIYSVGIVVKDKIDDGDVIQVVPIEQMNQVLGVLSEAEFNYDVSGKNHQGVDFSTAVKGVAYVAAQWKNMAGTNQMTAPNVYEGETVYLIKYGSSEEIYWSKLGREAKLRRLENVVYAWSNLEVKGEEYDLDTSHWVKVSSRDQIVHFHTSNNRGEKVAYDVIFDLANGTFSLVDSNKNSIFLDSVGGHLKLDINVSIEMNTQEFRFNGQTYYRVKAPEITEKGDNITNDASAAGLYKAGASMLSDSGGTSIVKGATPVAILPGVKAG